MKLPDYPAPNSPLLRSWGLDVVNYLRALTPRVSPTVLPKMTPNGTTYAAAPQTPRQPSAVAPLPWAVIRNDGVDESDPPEPILRVRVNVGTIGGVVPSNIFAELTIAGTGTEYVVVTLTCTANAPSSAVLSVESAAPVPSATEAHSPPGTCTDVLAIVQDGISYQVRTRNLQVESEEVFREPVASPVPGEMNYIPWHRWKIVEAV
jgi:hypothetical protein